MEDDRLVGIVTKFDFLKAFVFTTRQMVPHYDELMSGSDLRLDAKLLLDCAHLPRTSSIFGDALQVRIVLLMRVLQRRAIFPDGVIEKATGDLHM